MLLYGNGAVKVGWMQLDLKQADELSSRLDIKITDARFARFFARTHRPEGHKRDD